jgi:hypothetical protein
MNYMLLDIIRCRVCQNQKGELMRAKSQEYRRTFFSNKTTCKFYFIGLKCSFVLY